MENANDNEQADQVAVVYREAQRVATQLAKLKANLQTLAALLPSVAVDKKSGQ